MSREQAQLIKEKIFEKSGRDLEQIRDPSIKVVRDPATGILKIEGLSFPEESVPHYPGDKDPSRVIESAEIGMTFQVEPGDTLFDVIEERMTEIRQRVRAGQ
jgi:hypothetical protein